MPSRDFEAIYRTYFGPVYRYLLGLSKNADIAEELTAQTFFRALQKIEQFEGRGSLEGWLKQMGRNLFLDYSRQARPALRPEDITQLPDPEPLPSEQTEMAENLSQIEQLMHQLASPYREVFQLRVLEEMSFKQIGHWFNRTENWACVTYHRAKTKIQQAMEASL